MSCGFGALLLVFTILGAQIQEQTDVEVTDLREEVLSLEVEVAGAQTHLGRLTGRLAMERSARAATTAALGETRRAARQTAELLEDAVSDRAQRDRALERTRAELRSLAAEQSALHKRDPKEQAEKGRKQLRIEGEGQRQVLTGLRTGGRRVLILVDTSASMLARNIVNIVRLRHMDPVTQRKAPKWRQTVRTVEWIVAQLPRKARFQIYRFDFEVEPLIPGTKGRWLNGAERERVEDAIRRLHQLVPRGGTNLQAAFEAAASLEPRPDNVYLVVDGLPTQGGGRRRTGVVSGETRLRLFHRAIRAVPPRIPFNVILLPMEGDPEATAAYWTLARNTAGSLVSPAADWP